MYGLSFMFLHMCNLLYDFSVIFIALICLLWLVARRVVFISTHVNFENVLQDRDLTQKLHNNSYNVHNNNNNLLKFVWKVHQLYMRHMAQLVAGGLVTSELLYIVIQLYIYNIFSYTVSPWYPLKGGGVSQAIDFLDLFLATRPSHSPKLLASKFIWRYNFFLTLAQVHMQREMAESGIVKFSPIDMGHTVLQKLDKLEPNDPPWMVGSMWDPVRV